MTSGNGWTLEAFTVGTTLNGVEANRLVRSKPYSEGNLVELGGNGGVNGTCSMYNVVVVED